MQDVFPSHAAACLPPIALLAGSCQWSSLSVSKRHLSNRSELKLFRQAETDPLEEFPLGSESFAKDSFDPRYLEDFARILRNVRQHLPSECEEEQPLAVGIVVIDAMVEQICSLEVSRTNRRRYTTKSIIRCLMLSRVLRNSWDLRGAIQQSFKLMCPPHMANALGRQIERGEFPSTATLSRARPVVDVGFELWMRNIYFPELRADSTATVLKIESDYPRILEEVFTGYFAGTMCDSSHMGGQDYLLSENMIIKASVLTKASAASWELEMAIDGITEEAIANNKDVDNNLKQFSKTDGFKELVRILEECIDVHIDVPTASGSKESDSPHKMHCHLHAQYVKLGSWRFVDDFLDHHLAYCGDFGVEAGFPDSPKFDLSHMFPYLFQFDSDDDEVDGDMALSELLEPCETYFVKFGMQIPGLLHLLHNAAADVSKCMGYYPTWGARRKKVLHFLNAPHCKERFIEKCVEGATPPAAFGFVGKLESFDHKVAHWRWQSVIAAEEALQDLQPDLVRLWDASKYKDKTTPGPNATITAEANANAESTSHADTNRCQDDKEPDRDMKLLTEIINSELDWCSGEKKKETQTQKQTNKNNKKQKHTQHKYKN